jgi:hypothetical protein
MKGAITWRKYMFPAADVVALGIGGRTKAGVIQQRQPLFGGIGVVRRETRPPIDVADVGAAHHRAVVGDVHAGDKSAGAQRQRIPAMPHNNGR